ncbi:biofilm development regulator YmgB/AriR family protein [Erwinia sp. PK3-005]|uniref:Biofilm development protein AriR n=1 Tax=Mixta hanseatica TaxID=2872648 RepID=A0ABY4RB28_9GAMM|nr:biofilm/acid-resistance regulator YmgB/AriR [Mixta hanseatica]UQY45643.1 hypothetical protein K6958_08325 [Mixta hanseatica]
MQTTISQTDKDISDYFNLQDKGAVNEGEVLGAVVAEILQAGQPVTNKAIISRLIQRLELESDVVMLDVYRHVLEMVVNKTEDDIIG